MKVLLVAVGLLCVGVTGAASQEKHHEREKHDLSNPAHWYPIECCHEQDCAPATAVRQTADGELDITTKHGRVVVPKTFQIRESPDGRVHACVRPYSTTPICVFLPPAS